MELTIDLIRRLAEHKLLQSELKHEDSFVVSENEKHEVEQLLREAKIGYQGITQPANNILYIIQPYGEQG